MDKPRGIIVFGANGSGKTDDCLNLMLADIEKYRLFVLSAVDGDFTHRLG